LLDEIPSQSSVSLVKAEKGITWDPEDWNRFVHLASTRSNVDWDLIPDASHWLHTDKPLAVMASLSQWFRDGAWRQSF